MQTRVAVVDNLIKQVDNPFYSLVQLRLALHFSRATSFGFRPGQSGADSKEVDG